jgi:signal transduction histidine kinase
MSLSRRHAPAVKTGSVLVAAMSAPRPRTSSSDRLARLERPRVLIVDDLQDNRIILSRRLRRRGFEVAEATSGLEALSEIAQAPFDLILLDVIMPGMDGFETLAQIRAAYTAAELPVIMVTVRDAGSDVVRALRLGANDYVTKPFDFDVAFARIEAQVRLKQLLERAGRSQPELEQLVVDLRQAVGRAEAAAQAKAEFLANMSHEIRTPLNGMLALAELLAREVDDPVHRKIARTILDSTGALERLLADALDLSRVDAGKLEIRAEPFRPADVVARVAALFRNAAAAKGLRLKTVIDPAARVVAEGDALRLQQVLTNLVSNAIKFTEDGLVRCSVAAGDDGFRFEVRDSGIGFDPARAEALFGRFEQADSSIAARFGGSGLGLAISRRLAELMGGRLTAQSAPGKGSTFTLTVPLPVLEHAPAPAPADTAAPALPRAGRAPRILVAGDHEVNRRVLEVLLGGLGMNVMSVADGAQALDAVRSGGVDAVVIDVQMPVLDGLAAIREIRAFEAERRLARLPVIALSGHASEAHRARSLAAGADRHLTKPVHAEALAAALYELLSSAPALPTPAESSAARA